MIITDHNMKEETIKEIEKETVQNTGIESKNIENSENVKKSSAQKNKHKDNDTQKELRNKKKKERLDEVDLTQMSLFDTVKDDDILEELKTIDVGNLTPIEALNKLYELQNKIKNRW